MAKSLNVTCLQNYDGEDCCKKKKINLYFGRPVLSVQEYDGEITRYHIFPKSGERKLLYNCKENIFVQPLSIHT